MTYLNVPEPHCRCDCPRSRHYDDHAHYGEKLKYIDCEPRKCLAYEEVPPPNLREMLQDEIKNVARELLTINQSAACKIPLPNTHPQLYVVVGTAQQIVGLITEVSPDE